MSSLAKRCRPETETMSSRNRNDAVPDQNDVVMEIINKHTPNNIFGPNLYFSYTLWNVLGPHWHMDKIKIHNFTLKTSCRKNDVVPDQNDVVPEENDVVMEIKSKTHT